MENDHINQHYAKLLGFGDEWKVTKVDLNVLGRKLDIFLGYAAEAAICPVCGKLGDVYDQQPERVWRHLDTMQFETLIHAKTPRVKCADHKVKVIELPWASKSSHFTLQFEAFAIDVLKAARSIKDARQLLRLSWWQTQEIMKTAVEWGFARREGEEITFVGLDEKIFLKGMKSDAFACIMTDIDNRRVLDVARGRTRKGAETLINKALDPFQPYMVGGVAMDMSAWYEQVMKSGLKHMIKVANTLKDHLYGLLAWFDTRINNALTEGFNTTIQALKATAKGYRNFENFRTVILFYCGKLDMRPDFVRVGSTIE